MAFRTFYGIENGTIVQGIQGPQGFQGSTGPSGLDIVVSGFQGLQGLQGFLGYQGTQGPQGVQGIEGIQGFIGFQGNFGMQGVQGVDGVPGDQGSQGYDSAYPTIVAVRGAEGFIGMQGFMGVQGPQGRSGTIVRGFEGVQGASIAATGPRGAQGPQNAGPQGSSITAFMYGTGTSLASDVNGIVAALYTITDSNQISYINGRGVALFEVAGWYNITFTISIHPSIDNSSFNERVVPLQENRLSIFALLNGQTRTAWQSIVADGSRFAVALTSSFNYFAAVGNYVQFWVLRERSSFPNPFYINGVGNDGLSPNGVATSPSGNVVVANMAIKAISIA